MRRKSPVLVIVTVIIVLIVLCCGLLSFGAYFAFRRIMPFAGCMISFQAVQGSVLDYARDHKGKLPDADKWQDEVAPYYSKYLTRTKMRRQKFVKFPGADDQWGCMDGEGNVETGIAFNEALSGKQLDSIKDPATTALVFEIPHASRNAHQPYKDLGSNGPQIFSGAPRPWMVCYVERGMSNLNNNDGFKMDVRDDNDSDSSDSDSTDSNTKASPKGAPAKAAAHAKKPNPDVPGDGG
jgi:hypothetical protein